MSTFRWANGANPLSIDPQFILPEDKRPFLFEVAPMDSIPVIDMAMNEGILIEKIVKASEEYGFFQIINHGVSEELCRGMLDAIAAFIQLPPEEKALFTGNETKDGRVFSYFLKDENAPSKKISLWSEIFSHFWHPYTDNFIRVLPINPLEYREVSGKFAKEIGVVMDRLLLILSRGLGLKEDFLHTRLGKNPTYRAQANYYPPCPDPEMTLGLAVHTDILLLTLVLSSKVQGLQVIKDEKWLSVETLPNAFVINIGDQLQVISNGKYKSVHHRTVTNKFQTRVSIAMFYGPDEDAIVGPAEELVDDDHPPLYRNYRFAEFMEEFYQQKGLRRRVKEHFELPQ
ncbi:hypothetical protein Nepgr_031695 [Nepenthes gracilis]|uniref:Fe2OG dioxygenase domain-containing protein n=1 Tax=Nepenthes gracilis TaxID=150966 RepID=A0AAD3TJB3_NEPGR|nr:hypothetical protein Nepgr_031695 [Nepenthes gracilis]